jgi:hypothetical protein
LFGRTEKPTDQATPAKSSTATATSAPPADKKGRPTPSRKEAQAAAKERARAGMDKKAAAGMLKERRADSNKKMREGMKTGDDRYLPARDKGPVRRFVRDWVDSRVTFTEFIVPAMIFILVLSATGSRTSQAGRLASGLQLAILLLFLVDIAYIRFRLSRAVRERFPDENQKGLTFYAVTRTLTPRFLRVPKTQVKIGGQPK